MRDDERRAVRLGLGLGDGAIDRGQVVDVGDVQHLPAVRLKALGRIVAEREVGAPVDGDAVVVVEADELAELLVAGERRGLVRDRPPSGSRRRR